MLLVVQLRGTVDGATRSHARGVGGAVGRLAFLYEDLLAGRGASSGPSKMGQYVTLGRHKGTS